MQDSLVEYYAVFLAALRHCEWPDFCLPGLLWTRSISNAPESFGSVDLIAIALPKSDAIMKGCRSSVSLLPSVERINDPLDSVPERIHALGQDRL